MKILFIHQVYASQFYHLIRYLLRSDKRYEITFLSSSEDRQGRKLSLGESGIPITGVRREYFNYTTGIKHQGAPSVQHFADETFQGQAVYAACTQMRSAGYMPDIIVCHGRWGAGLFVKDAYPTVPLLLYSEFFSTVANARPCLAPGAAFPRDGEIMYRLANATQLISLDAADHVVTPTEFQKESHPAAFHPRMSVVFDGVDAQQLTPRSVPQIEISGKTINHSDEIVTYVTRNFEPYRGFETFMQAAAILLRQRPTLRILIGGGCENKGYGWGEAGEAYRKRVLQSVTLDRSRVHFLGPLSYAQLVHLLRFSQVHVYLTVPFVLSWSLIEAMALGCALVGSRTAPVEEVIRDNENGMLADFYAPEQVAAQVAALLADAGLRERLGKAARQSVLEHYAVEQTGPRFIALMESLVARAPPG